MKKLFVLIVLIFLYSLASGEILGVSFQFQEFDEDQFYIFISEWMNLVDIPQPQSFPHHYVLRHKDDIYEIRYSMFRETEVPSHPNLQLAALAQVNIMNMVGDEVNILSTSRFSDSDVQAEFNGDFGFTTSVKLGQTDYSNDFPVAMVNYYYRSGIGAMCQTILFSSMDVYTNYEFLHDFHSFRFP